MIYILSGNETFLIDNKINKIIKENEDSQIIKYDGSSKDFSVSLLLEECLNFGLFSSKKLIIVKDPIFLIKKIEGKEIDQFIEYTKNQDYEITIIFYTLEELFNERLKAFKDISLNSNSIKCNQLKYQDYKQACFELLNNRGINIDSSLVNELIKCCNNSLSLFNQNLDIIELYPDKLTNEILKELIITSNEDDVFMLINALTNRNVSESIRLTRKLLANENNINGLISILSNQLRFLYEVSYYNDIGDSKKTIMDKVNTKSTYRIDKAFDTLRNLKQNDILSILDKLSTLDYQSKTNYDLEDKDKFELFIVSLIK